MVTILDTIVFIITIVFSIIVVFTTIKYILTLAAHFYKYGINARTIIATIFIIVLLLSLAIFVMYTIENLNEIAYEIRMETLQWKSRDLVLKE